MGCREMTANPHWPICWDQGTAAYSLHAVWGEQAPVITNPVKSTALIQTHSASGCGFFLSMLKSCSQTWQPAQETNAETFCWENATFQVYISFSYLYIYTWHSPCRLMLANLLVVPASPMCHQQTAQLKAESDTVTKQRKQKSHNSATEKPQPALWNCQKKKPKLQLFSGPEQLKASGHFRDDVAGVPSMQSDLPKSYRQLLSCLFPWHSLFSALDTFPSQ